MNAGQEIESRKWKAFPWIFLAFDSNFHGIRNYFEVVPSIFNCCQNVIMAEEEEERDALCKVTMEEEEKIGLFQKTAELDPFAGEPHSRMSQICHRQGKCLGSAKEEKRALEKIWTLVSF